MCRRLPILLLVGPVLVLALGGCGDDDRAVDASTTLPGPPTTSDTLPPAVAESFDAADVEALCADFGRLARIDPDVDPDQGQVDRLRAVATRAPVGVAEPLTAVADFGQAVIDGDPRAADLEAAAAEASLLLVAYGLDACGLQVPLFDRLSGFDLGG